MVHDHVRDIIDLQLIMRMGIGLETIRPVGEKLFTYRSHMTTETTKTYMSL